MTDPTDFDVRDLRRRAMSAVDESVCFDVDADYQLDEEYVLAIRMLKAMEAIESFHEYAVENGVDSDSMEQMQTDQLDHGERAVLMAFAAMNQSYIDMGEALTDDDDDENPFKVSDGDDPIR